MYITGEMILKKLDPFYSISQNKQKNMGKRDNFRPFSVNLCSWSVSIHDFGYGKLWLFSWEDATSE